MIQRERSEFVMKDFLKRLQLTSINIMFPIHLVASLVLGFIGLVDWWIILFVWILTTDIILEFDTG